MAGSLGSNFDDDEGGGMISEINVTPLVDVVLVLLIVFMITVPAIVGASQLKVNLPESAAGEARMSELPLHVSLRREPSGGFGTYVNDRLVNEAELKDLVASVLSTNSEQAAFLAADKGLPYGEVVKVIDMLKLLGIKKLLLETRLVRP